LSGPRWLLRKESFNATRQATEAWRTCLALPHDQNSPSQFFEYSDVRCIPNDIALKFVLPINAIAGRYQESVLAIVAVPKAPMDENGPFAGVEDQIRTAWKLLTVKAVPESQ
jgi:hypothetical protein